MPATFTIALNDLHFHAPHGLYEGEASIGNEFRVQMELQTDGEAPVTHMEQSVNYVALYEIIRARMLVRTDLLETICQQIAGDVELRFPQALNIRIRIEKLTPAIPHFSGTVSVSFSKDCKH